MSLIRGDFNYVIDNKLDKIPICSKPQNRMSKGLTNMIEELGLIDGWRYLHPNEKDFSFNSQVHGSYFLMPKKDLFRIRECIIEPITIF